MDSVFWWSHSGHVIVDESIMLVILLSLSAPVNNDLFFGNLAGLNAGL